MNNEQQKKDLILAIIANYTWEDIKPFFLSLEKSGFSGEVVLFIENIDKQTQEILKQLKFEINLIPFERVGLEKLFNINDYRYYLYSNFLEAKVLHYNNILLTDVRDVYFQINPFDTWLDNDCITVATEIPKIKDEIWTTRWILQKFGHPVYTQLENEIVICSGTTFGPAVQILNYLKEMVYNLYYLSYYPLTVMDQAVHNYLVHTGKINPVAFSDNYSGPIMTLGYEKRKKIRNNSENQVLLKNGNVAPIIHQYDRHPRLVKLFRDLCN